MLVNKEIERRTTISIRHYNNYAIEDCSRIYKTSQDSSELNVILFHGDRSSPVSSPSY